LLSIILPALTRKLTRGRAGSFGPVRVVGFQATCWIQSHHQWHNNTTLPRPPIATFWRTYLYRKWRGGREG